MWTKIKNRLEGKPSDRETIYSKYAIHPHVLFSLFFNGNIESSNSINKFQFQTDKFMQRIPFGSPTKENLLPSPTKKRKGDPLSEILSFLKTSGMAVPPHINQLISANPQSPLKQTRNNIQEDDSKKLKFQLSECEFQLKKMQEDFAEYKRQSKLEKEKQNKKNEEQVSKLRSTLEASSQNSSFRLQMLLIDHEADKKGLKEKHRLELEQEVSVVKQTLQAKLESQEKLRKREIAELHRSHDRKLTQLTKSHQQIIALLQQRAQTDLQQLKMKHRVILEDKERRHQSVRVALQSQRRTEEKLHEKTKIEASKEKEKLICELCFEKNTRAQLEEESQGKQKQIKRLKSVVRDLQVDLQLLQEKRKKYIQQMKEGEQFEHQQIVQDYEQRVKQLMRSHQSELSKIESKLVKIEEIHEAKVELLSQNNEELACSFERRPSKPEDLSVIEKLKWSLAKRDEEVRKLVRDLKHCNLELENKEDIYTRMFRGSSMSRERRTPKEDREKMMIEQKLGKQALFRKSQTADLKYLLKIYNNTKNG